MKTTLLALALLLCSLAGRCAAPTAPFTLPNGLKVVVRERHATVLVGVDLWVRAGAREEGESEYGSAHFLEHTLFKGTTTRKVGDADADIETLGATLNAATGPDAAHFTTTVASSHLAEALAILADIVKNATLPETEIERERGVILDELAQHGADPSAIIVELLYANAFDSHPYRRSPGGTSAAIRARGRDTLAAFYRRTYTPDHCVLALAGDITPERAQAEAAKAFGNWHVAEKNAATPTALKALDESPLTAPRTAQANGETVYGQIGIAFRAPAASEKLMACAAEITLALLDSSSGGRLADALPTTETSVRYTPRQDASLFILLGTLSPPNESATPNARPASRLARLEEALLKSLDSLLTHPPTLGELNAAKSRVLGQEQYTQETTAGLARALGYAEIVGGDTPEAFRQRVQQLRVADVLQFVRQSLDPARRVTVKLLPKPVSSPADL